jgi:hypothetical protein
LKDDKPEGRGKKRPKIDVKAAPELLSHLKKPSSFFGKPGVTLVAGFKKRPKNPTENHSKNHQKTAT